MGDRGDVALNADLPRFRSLLGATAALWAGTEGVTVQERGWSALSGVRSVDYNVVFCDGASAGADLRAGVDRIAAGGVPAMVIVAGEALDEVRTLVELGWVCVGSVPLMWLALDPPDPARPPDPAHPPGPAGPAGPAVPADPPSAGPTVRRLDRDQLDPARVIVDQAFGVGPELARVALPRDAADRTGQSVWGAFDDDTRLVSCLAAVRAEEVVAIWSMATAAPARGRGYGRALLRAALTAEARDGARGAILYSSGAGVPFYRAFGYRELEHWQLWSRPRWVLGRS